MANEYVNDNHEIMGIDKVSKETRRIRTNADGELIISSADLSAILSTLQGELTTTLSGSYVRLSTEPLPTPEADGVKDGNDLLVIDPADKRNNKVYIYRTGAWREA